MVDIPTIYIPGYISWKYSKSIPQYFTFLGYQPFGLHKYFYNFSTLKKVCLDWMYNVLDIIFWTEYMIA